MLCKVLNGRNGLRDCITLLPSNRSIAAGVVETILTAGCPMKIKHDFEACTSGPANSLIQNRQLALDIRVTIQRRYGPVANGNSDMVQARGRDSVEVALGDPRVPVVGQTRRCFGLAEGLRVRIFVDDRLGVGPFTEDGRRDPRLEDEPASQIHASHFIVVVIEG